jgi:Ohr subfamily peroxiredoxin
LYTARTTTVGGRSGHSTTEDGMLDLDLRPPVEMGGPGGATNPEQLFAVGFSACFQSALATVARREGIDTSQSTVEGIVTIGVIHNGAFGLAVTLRITAPGVDRDKARSLVEAASYVCPYSNATRGNIELTLEIA